MYDSILNFGMIGPILLIVVGLAILIASGESLVRGATRLATAMKIPPLIIGLTVVAFGTGSPEVAISLSATLKGNDEIAIGNIVGSNICNVCLILGLVALLRPIAVSSSLIRREIPLMIGVSVLLFVFALLHVTTPLAGRLVPWQGTIFIALLLGYVAWLIYEVLAHRLQNEEYVKGVEENATFKRGILFGVVLMGVGFGFLILGSEILVQGAVRVAQNLGVSELVIGLTIIAVGTSMPELVVSGLAALNGNSDLAVGNIIGTNIFNILGVLGLSTSFSFMTPPLGVAVSSQSLWLDMSVMILTAILCSVICITGHRVTRGEGVFLLLCYAAYLSVLCFLQMN